MDNVCVKILEQPIDSIRFRYKSENKSISNIYGVNSTLKRKTFPSIQIEGYEGCAEVVVSCVTKDPPYRPHPHSLVGRKECKQGICRIKVNDTTNIVTFSNLGIQCVTRRDIKKALNERQALGIDPFKTGFKLDSDIDLNAVRLCFQVKLKKSNGKCILPPLKSNIIYNIKIRPPLVLHELSPSDAAVVGGQKVIILCDKVADEKDIQVRFFEENEGKVVWEKIIDSDSIHVHKQVAIRFKTPKYHLQKVGKYQVKVQLRRQSDQTMSNSLPFDMIQLPFGTDRSSNSVEVDPFSYGESVGSSLPPASSSHNNVETVVPPSQMQWSSENVPIQKQQHQTNIPMMPNVPALTSTLSEYHWEPQWEPNLYFNDIEVPLYDTSAAIFQHFPAGFSPNSLEPVIAFPESESFTEWNNDMFSFRQQQEYQSTGSRIWNRAPDIPASTNVQSPNRYGGIVRKPEDQKVRVQMDTEFALRRNYFPLLSASDHLKLSIYSNSQRRKLLGLIQRKRKEEEYVRSIDLEEKKKEDRRSSFNGSSSFFSAKENLSGLSISDSMPRKTRSFECLFSTYLAEQKDLKYQMCSVKKNLTEIANLSINLSGLSISDSTLRKTKSLESLSSTDLGKTNLEYRKCLAEKIQQSKASSDKHISWIKKSLYTIPKYQYLYRFSKSNNHD